MAQKSLTLRYVLLSVAALLAVTAYTIYWHVLADRIETGIARWAEARRAEGMVVEYASLRVTGFPLRVQPEATGVRLVGPGTEPTWAWSSATLTGNVLPYNINHVVLTLPDAQEVGVRIDGGALEQYTLAPEKTRASLRLDRGKIMRLDVDVSGGAISGGRLQAGPMTLGRAQLHTRRQPAGSDTEKADMPELLDVAVKFENIDYPGFADSALGPHLTQALLNMTVEGEWPTAEGVAGIRQWRDAGGIAQIAAVDILWGPLNVKATGTVALDAQDRLIGSLTAKLVGYENLVRSLQDAGQLDKNEALAARTALGLISMAAGDARGELTLPLVAQDGEMFLGPVRIAKLQPLY